MKSIKIGISLFCALMLLCATAVFVQAEYFVLEKKWSIEWCLEATKLKLKKYDLTGRPEELRTWLLTVDGAPGQEAAVLFLSWGLDNQNDFEFILEGIDAKRRPAIIDFLAGMVIERGMEDSFRASFLDRSSPRVLDLFAAINRYTDEADY